MQSPVRVPALFFLCLVGFCLFANAQGAPFPSWVYSSYFGGTGQDTITATTVDDAGNVYVAGTTTSSNFPTTSGVYEPTYPGPSGANVIFVSKFSGSGELVWSTFVGPGSSQFMVASGIAVDAEQNVYASGIFQGSGFPTTAGLPNSGSVFAVKLNANASELIYGTTLGGNSTLANPQIVLDSSADAFIIGSGDYCCNSKTGIIGPLGGISDFWIGEIAAAGNAIPWSVEIGGSDLDLANAAAVDASNKLYVTGYTASSDFPYVTGSLNQAGTGRAFALKLDPSQPPTSSLLYTALLGNPGNNTNDYIEGKAIAVDSAGDAYLGTWTYNLKLFTSPWAFQPSAPTVPNVYVTELNPSGSALINGTYVGGSNADFITSISIDNESNLYAGGFSYSTDFPVTAYGYNGQAYYLKLNPQFAAESVVAFGGSSSEVFAAPADGTGGLWATGYSGGLIPTTSNAYQPQYAGDDDGFLVHTNFSLVCSLSTGVKICSIAADPNLSERINFVGQAANVEQTVNSQLAIDDMVAYGIHASQFDAWIPVAPGRHNATMTSQTVSGQQSKQSLSFIVANSSSCPLNPIVPSLTLCSPLNAAVLTSPISVQAVANDSSAPKAVKLYVDGKFVATIQGQNGTYSYSLTLASGVHRLIVQGFDPMTEISTTAVLRVK